MWAISYNNSEEQSKLGSYLSLVFCVMEQIPW